VVSADEADALEALLTEQGESVFRIGTVTDQPGVAYSGKLA
jgi:phosphoribosylformylglycinamidine cyclo-ligase